MSATGKHCGICKEIFGNLETVTLTQKGCDSINEASNLRGSNVFLSVGDRVHTSCRKRHTNKKDIDICDKQSTSNICPRKRSVRLTGGPFLASTDCLFCGTTVDFSKKYKPRSEQVKVRTFEFAETLKKCCETRCDEWSFLVKGRIEYFVSDLHAADCVYHRTCSTNFRTGKNIPQEYARIEQSSKRQRQGRPINEEQEEAFLRTCTYLESNDEEQLVIGDLILKMEEYLKERDCKAYDRRYMKRKLEEHYGESIIISGESGKADIITLKETADQILRSYYAKSKECELELQKIHIIETAARLIKSDVKACERGKNVSYPSINILTTEKTMDYLPASLRLFCTKLFVGQDVTTKVGAIGQTIMQAIRPRALICPLQIGVAIQMHHNFRSRYIIDVLHHLGFCSSYAEVIKFERNAAVASSSFLEDVTGNNSILFAADNIDHNIRTLDGKNTFHGMGMISAITPEITLEPIVPRYIVTDEAIKNIAHVTIQVYNESRNLLKDITFYKLEYIDASIRKIDILWQLSWSFPENNPSNWSGMMQTAYNYSNLQHSGKASIRFLPIINIAPSDMTCVLSTLLYLNKLAHDKNVPCIITFDQPLYWKASQIIHVYKELENIILMLGSFHTLMNLLGSIGTLMNGSGLNEVFQEIYSPNAVLQMMTGKAVSRAIRGHMLVDAALSTLLITDVFPCNEDGSCNKLIKDAATLYDGIMSGKEPIANLETSGTLSEIVNSLKKKKLHLQSSDTSKLWLAYQEMVKTVRKLIAADRSSSWQLHLEATHECLVIAAAAGHHNYLKSGYKYLQDMLKLPSKYPSVYESFAKGQFVIRRSNRFWAGLGSDLLIEQLLMRSIKSRGGLTRGSRLTEIQLATWVKSMPVCSLYNLAMQEYCSVSFETSEQHKEIGETRRFRDISDFHKVIECIKPISPFQCDTSLRNIITGVTADKSVNVHELHLFGTAIINTMVGKPVYTYHAKRSDRVKTLGSLSAVISEERGIDIDPALLFQRMMTVATVGEMDLADVLNYELCAFPPALFESRNLLRKADKPQLAHAITKKCGNLCIPNAQVTQANIQYVLDGGSLLHRLSWSAGDTYLKIADSYTKFTLHNYGRAIVVFDGYGNEPSIKDMTHRRRITSKISKTVNFNPDMKFVGQKENFLANNTNKQRFIMLLSKNLTKVGCTVQHADGDADFNIVHSAVLSSQNVTTVTIGEDTDLLVLLLYHAKSNSFKLYLRSDIKRETSINPVYDILGIQALLGEHFCNNILFLHAFTGSDTTSRIFGIGKATALEKLMNDKELQGAAKAFSTDGSQHFDIESAGKKAMLVLYGGKVRDSLQTLRHRMLVGKVAAAKSFVTPERLPPTESATKYHSFRTYYQINVWKANKFNLTATDWGWFVKDNSYYPTISDMPPAPEWLLKMIHCSCKTQCVTMRCGCKRNGLPCSVSCGECQISGCDNIVIIENNDSDSDD